MFLAGLFEPDCVTVGLTKWMRVPYMDLISGMAIFVNIRFYWLASPSSCHDYFASSWAELLRSFTASS